ncbi:PEP-dependent dihydroxyacetone kinase, ADP-binding subunit DhaL [bioreactor metagenome]|uniref:PEP-dependent dihydroxyacetone kinase, ADP-binding subunit DhaL n=1 Tax=bioreactor metagenome TaxID=1076179 RepID=A0A645IA91_9ZZZZ
MGGAIGPVYYYFWNSLCAAIKHTEEITTEELAQGFEKAAAKIMTACNVKQGDKTVLDAILPAARAMAEHYDEPLAQALAAAVQAADQGREATFDMVAQKGRARFLGEKSKSHYDAGATSFVLWLKELEKAINMREIVTE